MLAWDKLSLKTIELYRETLLEGRGEEHCREVGEEKEGKRGGRRKERRGRKERKKKEGKMKEKRREERRG